MSNLTLIMCLNHRISYLLFHCHFLTFPVFERHPELSEHCSDWITRVQEMKTKYDSTVQYDRVRILRVWNNKVQYFLNIYDSVQDDSASIFMNLFSEELASTKNILSSTSFQYSQHLGTIFSWQDKKYLSDEPAILLETPNITTLNIIKSFQMTFSKGRILLDPACGQCKSQKFASLKQFSVVSGKFVFVPFFWAKMSQFLVHSKFLEETFPAADISLWLIHNKHLGVWCQGHIYIPVPSKAWEPIRWLRLRTLLGVDWYSHFLHLSLNSALFSIMDNH